MTQLKLVGHWLLRYRQQRSILLLLIVDLLALLLLILELIFLHPDLAAGVFEINARIGECNQNYLA